jgi:hypothetical protein
MTGLIKQINVTPAIPLYTVWVNQAGYDGGSNYDFSISSSPLDGISSSDMDSAVQAFADSLALVSGITILSIKKNVVVETTL